MPKTDTTQTSAATTKPKDELEPPSAEPPVIVSSTPPKAVTAVAVVAVAAAIVIAEGPVDKSNYPNCEFCEENTVEVYCSDCPKNNSLCGYCSKVRHTKSSSAGHKIIPWTLKHRRPICSLHNQECLLYCKQDKVVICTLCIVCNHKDHQTVIISDDLARCDGMVKDAMVDLEQETLQV